MKTITVIDNYDSFVHNLVRYIREEDYQVNCYRNDDPLLDDLATIEDSDAILLSPGPGLPANAGRMNAVIENFATQIPILGVCLGHQAIAEFFGSKLFIEETPIHGKASTVQRTDSSRLLNHLPRQFEVGRYHSWSVEDVPNDFIMTAKLDDGTIMAMEHCSLPIFGVQFHPESILTPNGRDIIRNFLTVIA